MAQFTNEETKMIPDFLCRLLGPNWRTSSSAIIAGIAGFIAISPDLFHNWPILLGVSKYISIGGFINAGLQQADATVLKKLAGDVDAQKTPK